MGSDVTVIIADRGAAATAEAVACVQAQREVETDIVVVDTSARERSEPDTAPGAPKRIGLPADSDGCAAYNEGARHGTGTWLAFLDARDRWSPDHLVTMVHGCVDAGADFGCCAAWLVDDEGSVQGFRAVPPSADLERAFLRGDGVASPSGLLVRRSFWQTAGGFDDWLTYLAALDACIRWSRCGIGWSSAAPTVALLAPASRTHEQLRALTAEFRELRRRFGVDAKVVGERFGDGELAAYLAREHMRAGRVLQGVRRGRSARRTSAPRRSWRTCWA